MFCLQNKKGYEIELVVVDVAYYILTSVWDFRRCSFRYRVLHQVLQAHRCELLSNVYLCNGINIVKSVYMSDVRVVNCFQMCIFAVALTSRWWQNSER